MDHQSLSKKIFSTCLFSFLENIPNKQRGFIPDVINILSTYSLTEYLQTWLLDCSFPPKQTWKNIVRSAVSKLHQTNRNIRLINDNDFYRFKSIIQNQNPSFIWSIPSNSYEISLCKFICKLKACPPEQTPFICLLCNTMFVDVFQHISCSCPSTYDLRTYWWDQITKLF